MNSLKELPEGYRQYAHVDLQNDKKLATVVNVLGVIIMVVMIFLGSFIEGLHTLFDYENFGLTFLRLGVMLVGMVIYLILHELTHAAVMKYYGVSKVKFGFTGLYAFAGCDKYIRKAPYLVVALAPVVVWGVVLLAVNLLVPVSWFWVVYFLQIMNIGGAAGDFYVTVRFVRLPADIYVRDTGTAMTVFTKE